MKKRPLSVTVVSLVFILIGAGGLVRGLWSWASGVRGGITNHELIDIALVSISGILALVSGLFMLRGANWARWLCIVWMALHVVISIGHEMSKVVVHSVMLLVLLVVLLWPNANSYFRSEKSL
jgi:hypothetical protein